MSGIRFALENKLSETDDGQKYYWRGTYESFEETFLRNDSCLRTLDLNSIKSQFKFLKQTRKSCEYYIGANISDLRDRKVDKLSGIVILRVDSITEKIEEVEVSWVSSSTSISVDTCY